MELLNSWSALRLVLGLVFLGSVALFLFWKRKDKTSSAFQKQELGLQEFTKLVEQQKAQQQNELNRIEQDLFAKRKELSELEWKCEMALNNVQSQLNVGKEQYLQEYFTNKQILDAEVLQLQTTRQKAIEAFKREEESENLQQFHMLDIDKPSLEDIELLRDVARKLHTPEVLGKVIWKVYYEKAYTSLVGRVIGPEVKTGIYKITNVINHKCYVGQAVNIKERWRQHMKRGVGADPMTQNKLYPAMREVGIHNFTFEIIEECSRENLSAREQYWQTFFGAKEYGYSIK